MILLKTDAGAAERMLAESEGRIARTLQKNREE
jgi:hypothetical protein